MDAASQSSNDRSGPTGPGSHAEGTVGAIMTRTVVTVTMDHTVAQIRDLFHRHGFHHLLVVDNGHAAGLISDRDLLKHMSPFVGTRAERSQDSFCLQRRAHQIMTRSLIWIPAETPITDAIALLLAHGITCLPILDEYQHVMGIVTWRDLLRAALHQGLEAGVAHLPATHEVGADAIGSTETPPTLPPRRPVDWPDPASRRDEDGPSLGGLRIVRP